MADRHAALGTTSTDVGPRCPRRAPGYWLAFAIGSSSVCREGSFSGKFHQRKGMGTASFHRGFYCFIKFSLMRTSSPAAVSLPFICTHRHAAGTFKAVLVPTPSSLFPLNYSEPSFYFHALIQVLRRNYLLLLSYRLPRPPWLVSSLISLQLLPAPESPALLSPPKQGSDSSC